jgi:hypothetical protein
MREFSWLSSAPPGKCRDGASIWPRRPIPSGYNKIHNSSIILPFDIVQTKTLTES